MRKQFFARLSFLTLTVLMLSLCAAAVLLPDSTLFSPSAETVYYFDKNNPADLDVEIQGRGISQISVTGNGTILFESLDYEVSITGEDSFILTFYQAFILNYTDEANLNLLISTAIATDYPVTIKFRYETVAVTSISALIKPQCSIVKPYDKTKALPQNALNSLTFYINGDQNKIIELTQLTGEYLNESLHCRTVNILTFTSDPQYEISPSVEISVTDPELIDITKRQITVSQDAEIDLHKVYDGSTQANVVRQPIFDNLLNGDESAVTMRAQYNSKDVTDADSIAVTYQVDPEGYYLPPPAKTLINAGIIPCPAKVIIEDKVKIYSDADPDYTYRIERTVMTNGTPSTVNGLFSGDVLFVKDGCAAIVRAAGEDVTEDGYNLTGNLYNENYSLSTQSGKLLIKPAIITGIDCHGHITPDYRSSTEFWPKDLSSVQLSAFRGGISADVGVAIGAARYENSYGPTRLYVTEFSFTGANAGNFVASVDLVSQGFYLNAEFNRLRLTVIRQAEVETVKIYDGSATAKVLRAPQLGGILSGDTVNITTDAQFNTLSAHANQINLRYYSDHKGYLVEEVFTVTKNVKILKKAINVRAIAAEKIQGSSDPKLEYIADGLIAGDSLSGILMREAGESTGKYLITLGSLHNDNYDISYVGAEFVIRGTGLKGCAAVSVKPSGPAGLTLCFFSLFVIALLKKSNKQTCKK